MDLVQFGVIAALVIALFALGRSYVPPRSRDVRALRAEVNELGVEVDDLTAKINKRVKVEGVAQAREVRAATRAQRDLLAEDALKVLAEAKERPAAPPLASKEAVRALINAGAGPKAH